MWQRPVYRSVHLRSRSLSRRPSSLSPLHPPYAPQTYSAVCETHNTWQAYTASMGVLAFTCVWLGEIIIQLLAVFRDGFSATLGVFMQDPLNWLECASVVASAVANSMAIAIGAADDDVPSTQRNAMAGFMCVASLLAWLRLFDLVRGQPDLGFYSQLMLQALADIKCVCSCPQSVRRSPRAHRVSPSRPHARDLLNTRARSKGSADSDCLDPILYSQVLSLLAPRRHCRVRDGNRAAHGGHRHVL